MICLDSVSRVLIYRVKLTYFTLRALPIKVALPTNVRYKHSLWNFSLYLWDFIIWVPLNLSSCPKRLPQLDITDSYRGSGALAQQLLQQLSGVSIHAPSTISQQPFLSHHRWNETFIKTETRQAFFKGVLQPYLHRERHLPLQLWCCMSLKTSISGNIPSHICV